jgi:hypothetical protein
MQAVRPDDFGRLATYTPPGITIDVADDTSLILQGQRRLMFWLVNPAVKDMVL